MNAVNSKLLSHIQFVSLEIVFTLLETRTEKFAAQKEFKESQKNSLLSSVIFFLKSLRFAHEHFVLCTERVPFMLQN